MISTTTLNETMATGNRTFDYNMLVRNTVENAIYALDILYESNEPYEIDAESNIIFEEIDNSLIYTVDQWTVMREFCTPESANWETAYEYYADDVSTVIYHYYDRLSNITIK